MQMSALDLSEFMSQLLRTSSSVSGFDSKEFSNTHHKTSSHWPLLQQ